MFTREDLRAVPLFSALGDEELDFLAKTSADIHLMPSEYVVHEGETRRAMFVLIEGRIELTKFIEGEERIVGTERGAGEVFNEIPVVLNTPSLASFRAIQPSRVMRIESREFHELAQMAPQISAAITAAALERVEGLQEIAATPLPPRLLVIGPQFDNATHELREFLQRNSVEFDWNTPEDATQSYPVVRLRDGTIRSRPSIRDLATATGLSVSPQREMYDVAIVGGGPAGLAAAVYGSSEGLATILLETEAPGGQAGTSSRIENYLGFPFGISGDELANRALQQAKRLGAEIVVTRTVGHIDTDSRTLLLDGDESLRAKSFVLASGVAWRQLNLASLDRLRGCGVYYGAAPGEAISVQGKDIFLVGGGNSAGQAAINFSNYAKSVTLLVRGDALAKSMSYYLVEQLNAKPNVQVETCSEIIDVFGEECLEAIAVFNTKTKETTRRDAAALFIMIGADAETTWLPPEIARDPRGYVITGPDVKRTGHWDADRDPYLLETTVPGIFAVGDVRAGSVKRVAAAVGEGSMAIAFVHQYLDWRTRWALSHAGS